MFLRSDSFLSLLVEISILSLPSRPTAAKEVERWRVSCVLSAGGADVVYFVVCHL